jgi:hypothetical protein
MVGGGLSGGVQGLIEERTMGGMARGALFGAGFASLGWGAGRLAGWIRPLPLQPQSLPNYRTGAGGQIRFGSIQQRWGLLRRLMHGHLMVRTNRPDTVTYGGLTQVSYSRRHHVKPLSLGGADHRTNMIIMDVGPHAPMHPTASVRTAPLGTMFY